VSIFELKIQKFRGDQQVPKEFLDWVLAVEEVFEFNGVHTFRGRVAVWWQQLKQNRKR
jgi:hypothetical protein